MGRIGDTWPFSRPRAARLANGRACEAVGSVVVMNRVLLIGLAPETVDLSNAPIDLATLKERIAVGNTQVLEAGYDAHFCEIGTDVDGAVEQVRAALGHDPWDVVMIGAGVRSVPAYTELFEAVLNLAHDLAPGARFAFNAGPDTTLEALQRAADGQGYRS